MYICYFHPKHWGNIEEDEPNFDEWICFAMGFGPKKTSSNDQQQLVACPSCPGHDGTIQDGEAVMSCQAEVDGVIFPGKNGLKSRDF